MSTDSYLQKHILLQTSVEYLQTLCLTNSQYYQICRSKEFWQEKYAQNGLLLLKEFPTVEEYILDFQTCSNILQAVDPLINLLQSTFLEDKLALIATSPEINDYNLPEVDLEKVRLMYQRVRYDWSSDLNNLINRLIPNHRTNYLSPHKVIFIASVEAWFYYSKSEQTWVITFIEILGQNETHIRIPLSEQSARTFLYIQLYRGAFVRIAQTILD